jgi:16S rRNA (uracil1498-N3)-methyltransferase
MGLPRFYVDSPLAAHTSVALSEAVTRHVHVLRLAVGDEVCLFDGSGHEYRARLDAIDRRSASASLGEATQPDTEARYAITLAQGVAGGDKMDWLIEKAVELGVHAIAPLQTERGVVRLSGERAVKRVQHWQALVQAACEQCGRGGGAPPPPPPPPPARRRSAALRASPPCATGSVQRALRIDRACCCLRAARNRSRNGRCNRASASAPPASNC